VDGWRPTQPAGTAAELIRKFRPLYNREEEPAIVVSSKEWTRHGTGVLSKIRRRDGARIYFAQITWRGKRYTEKAGRTERDAVTLLGQRQFEVDNDTYTPSRLK
jgi:hypothetical protein